MLRLVYRRACFIKGISVPTRSVLLPFPRPFSSQQTPSPMERNTSAGMDQMQLQAKSNQIQQAGTQQVQYSEDEFQANNATKSVDELIELYWNKPDELIAVCYRAISENDVFRNSISRVIPHLVSITNAGSNPDRETAMAAVCGLCLKRGEEEYAAKQLEQFMAGNQWESVINFKWRKSYRELTMKDGPTDKLQEELRRGIYPLILTALQRSPNDGTVLSLYMDIMRGTNGADGIEPRKPNDTKETLDERILRQLYSIENWWLGNLILAQRKIKPEIVMSYADQQEAVRLLYDVKRRGKSSDEFLWRSCATLYHIGCPQEAVDLVHPYYVNYDAQDIRIGLNLAKCYIYLNQIETAKKLLNDILRTTKNEFVKEAVEDTLKDLSVNKN